MPMGWGPCSDLLLGLWISANSIVDINTAKSLQKSRKQFVSKRKRSPTTGISKWNDPFKRQNPWNIFAEWLRPCSLTWRISGIENKKSYMAPNSSCVKVFKGYHNKGIVSIHWGEGGSQGSKGMRQWPVNWYLSLMMIHKINPSVDYN